MCLNNGIADEWQWQTGHAVLRKVNSRSRTPYVLITEVPVNGNGRQITWPPPQSVAVAERLICVNN